MQVYGGRFEQHDSVREPDDDDAEEENGPNVDWAKTVKPGMFVLLKPNKDDKYRFLVAQIKRVEHSKLDPTDNKRYTAVRVMHIIPQDTNVIGHLEKELACGRNKAQHNRR